MTDGSPASTGLQGVRNADIDRDSFETGRLRGRWYLQVTHKQIGNPTR
jgi:hypothetical protein